MRVRVIDDTGNIWDADSPAFREAFNLAWVDGDASRYLVDNMGFIRVLLRAGSARVVDFNPATVAAPAIAGLIKWLHDQRQAHEVLCLAHGPAAGSRRHQIFGSGIAALHELNALVEAVRGSRLPFISLSESVTAAAGVPTFAALFAHWRARCGLFTEAEYRPLLGRHAADRFITFAPRPADGSLKIVHAGGGLHIPDKRSHAALNGAQLTEVADRAFGQWTSGIYRSVLERQAPRYDHIHALIHWPGVGGVERKYSRLILPCRTEDGEPLLLGVTGELVTSGLDIEAA
jgi:hypothetical protein